MDKEQFIYILKENEALKLKLQRVEQSTERLQTRYYDTETQLDNFKRKYEFLYSQFKELSRQCFPRDFIDKEIGSASEKETYDFLLTKIRGIEQESFELSKENKEKVEELKKLAEELERYKNAPQIIANTVNTEETDGEQKSSSSIVQRPLSVSADNNPILSVMSSITEQEWSALSIIGTGKTLFSDITSKLSMSNNTAKDLLDILKEKGVVSFEKVMKGGKGRPAFHYFLTPLGVDLYSKKFNNSPETTKLEELSTHGSPSHGGLMAEVGKFFEENNCEVSYDGPDTSYKLNNGKEVRFDLKVHDPKGKELFMVETERAKCGEQHLKEKFEKCLDFTKLLYTKTIYFVAPNRETLSYIQQQLFKWVKNQDNIKIIQNKDLKSNAAIIFKTATLDDLKCGKIQEFYYGFK